MTDNGNPTAVTVGGQNAKPTNARLAWLIVNRGKFWLLNTAHFKGAGLCFRFEVERTRHVTMTVHRFQKNMADESELFLFGDDFDAILDALEDEDAIQEEFNDAVVQLRIFYSFFHFAVIFKM